MTQATDPLQPAQEAATGGGARRARATPLSARGESMVWLSGGALAVCILMIATLLGVVIYEGSRTFLVRPIERVVLLDGKVFLGMPVRDEAYDPPAAELADLRARRDSGKVPRSAFDESGRPIRRLYRVENREVMKEPGQWVPLHAIAEVSRPADAVLVERLEWGNWLGTPAAVVRQRTEEVPGPAEAVVKETPAADGKGRITREVLRTGADGKVLVREREYLAEGPEATLAAIVRLHPAAVERRAEMERLNTHEVGATNRGLERERLRVARAELDLRLAQERPRTPLPMALWAVCLIGGGAVLVWAFRASRPPPAQAGMLARRRPWHTAGLAALWASGLFLMLAAWLEHPWSGTMMTAPGVEEIRVASEATRAEYNKQFQAIKDRVARIDSEDDEYRVMLVEPSTGRFAPARQTEPDEPLRLSRIVRVIPANSLSAMESLGTYAARWHEFLFDNPRESNTAGGVYPVIFGTVLLTLLLSIAVVPLGVVAALYLREYSRQGPLTSAVRIAVNNLAGVPSIVYGVFGLGFFCYTVGKYIDRGPPPEAQATEGGWWMGAGVLALAGVLAVALGAFSSPLPGVHPTKRQRWLGAAAGILWVGAVAAALYLIATTPYFGGFFAEKGNTGTFGTKGLLWSALTLALLTLPVVIVATEEAIAAVPRSMREGSYGCGATKWQTIRRIVLPRAMPGIMTGMVLAMARGAGEVAPLMLVGVVKKADELPLNGEWPFLHAEQSFMHLGFHIYDVGFQSPDSEAARPLVWCTTLLLILIVVMLNAAAVRIRSRLRQRFFGETF